MPRSRTGARRLPAALAAAAACLSVLAVVSGPAGAGSGSHVLVYGSGLPNASTYRSAVAGRLRSLGHTVDDMAALPAGDLAAYDAVWHVGAFSALSADEQSRLAAFLAGGGGVHLSGEFSCCAEVGAFVSAVTGDAVSTVRRSGLTEISFAPGARDGVTQRPNALGSLSSVSLGELDGVAGDNVLATSAGTVVGGAWGPDDMVSGSGRLTVLMDINWLLQSSRAVTGVVENLQAYLHAANAAPVVVAGGPAAGVEGSPVALWGSVVDPDGDAVVVSWGWTAGEGVDAGASCAFGDPSAPETTVTCTDDGTYVLTLTASDGVNPPVASSTTLGASNAPPLVDVASPQGAVVPVGMAVDALVAVADPGANDSHTCVVDWGDGTLASCDEPHAYGAAGVYPVVVSVRDDDGGAGSGEGSVVAYDPDGGFVTGGGVLGDRPGTPFNLRARYERGSSVPSGHFRLGSGGSGTFEATSFAWLVVDAAAGRAELAGVGALDGDPGHAFRLSVRAGHGRDRGTVELRVHGAAAAALGGATSVNAGSVQVHPR